MSNLSWQERRNIETSFIDFLVAELSSTTVFYKGENKSLDIRVGFSPRQDWNLPVISVYVDTRTAPREFVGQNKRIKTHVVIIDVRALDDGMRQDLADLVADTINNGLDYYTYTPSSSTPDTPDKVLAGKISVEFIGDTPVRLGENVVEFDQHRHNITLNINIAT